MVKKERSQENGNRIGNAMENLRRDGIGTRNGKIAVKDLNGKIGK